MQPVLAMPMHDPDGQLFPHLKRLLPQLKTLFARAYVSVPPGTRLAHPDEVAWLSSDDFFDVCYLDAGLPLGDEFAALYRRAAAACSPEQVIHLCFLDRVAFALQSGYRAAFIADIQALSYTRVPLIFQRSEAAWATHPANYRQIEGMVTRIGELLWGRTLDFAWCHLAISAEQLSDILPRVRNHDLSMVAEIVLYFRDRIGTQDVDWLAWEDPFILSRDARQLRAEREVSVQETRKRLAYVIPMLELLYAAQ